MMNFQYFKYAVEIEKTGSISKAAENLFMNQPNLSKAIKELEQMVGVSIFNRTTKGVTTTDEGRVFMEYAKNILSQLEDMKSHFHVGFQKKETFRIVIPRASYIAEAFTAFVDSLKKVEDFHITFKEADSMLAINSVIDDGYDMGVIRYRSIYEHYFLSLLKEKKLDYKEILAADRFVAISKKNKLARKKILQPENLDGLIEITNGDFTMPRFYSGQKTAAEQSVHSRRQISVYERGSQFDLLSRVSETFMWVSPMPEDVLSRNGLVQKKCNAPNTDFKDILIFRNGYVFTGFEKAFLEKVYEVQATILYPE